mgnify:CR=1 FL=1|jgi:predicted DNA-binding transcriptional regulator AlpA|tara:strand:- start:903 stop:1127 length:225 start_codon:yes stop_codon:yes gene_type:complete
MDRPYLTASELAELFNMSKGSLLNAISREEFPLPTYRLGKQRVADREVVRAFFNAKRAEGLKQITTRSGYDNGR